MIFQQHQSCATDQRAGFALAAVLWFLVLVASVTAPFAVAARTEFLIASNRLAKVRLDTLADAVSTFVSLRLMHRPGAGDIPQDSTLISCSSGAYAFAIRIQNQSGLIDLNTANSDLLAVGLDAVGKGDANSKELVDAIIDFRNGDFRASEGRSTILIDGGLKRGPFETVVELTDFEPMRDVEPARFRSAFTVHSGQSTVAMLVSPPELADRLKGSREFSADDLGGSLQAFAVEVSVNHRQTGIKGYSGFVIQPSEAAGVSFRRVENLIEPIAETDPGRPGRGCPQALHGDIALLAGEEF